MSRRRERHRQFSEVFTGWYGSLSPDLLFCSQLLLERALDERRKPVSRTPNNHYSRSAVGSIALLIDGFEAWLNESIWHLAGPGNSDKLRKLADLEIIPKYYRTPRRITGVEIPANAHLKMAVDVRNEIAHFLPRIVEETAGPARQVPPWLQELYEEQLFFVPERLIEEVELPLNQLLSSYRLAYWAWETVAAAAKAFCEAVSSSEKAMFLHPGNFELYRNACPPRKLPEYDAQHGLSTK